MMGSNSMLPVIAQKNDLSLVEVDGQAVITAADLAKGLEYKSENAIHVIVTRNRNAFKDFGLYDLTKGHEADVPLSSDPDSRGFQNESPLSIPRSCDTALVQLLTPTASDGRGGGLQSLRVFTKRGALKVCMKSNQPKAIAVQEALIDLYEKVESGELVAARSFAKIVSQLANLEKQVVKLKGLPRFSVNLPDDKALPITIERGRVRSMPFFGGFRYAEVRELVIELRKAGCTYTDIEAAVKSRWPQNTDHHVCRSSIHRFWTKARRGLLKENGIDVTH